MKDCSTSSATTPMKPAYATSSAKSRISPARWRAKSSPKAPPSTVEITPANVNDFLGVLKYREFWLEKQNEIGLTNGLAWTEVGGSVLTTEATLMEGKGRLTLTGKLGDVMQESAQAAMSYIRSKASTHRPR